MTDQSARLMAIDPQRSFLIQAPAGSGKTELLTARILNLLAQACDAPESLIAITFTRKAAQEMRERVIQALEQGAQAAPSHEPALSRWHLAQAVLAQSEKRGWDLLRQPHRLQIMTFDAFCRLITRQVPFATPGGVDPDVADDPSVLYELAAQATLDDLLSKNSEALHQFLSHLDNNQEIAVQNIAHMLASREQWMPILMTQSTARSRLENNIAILVDYLVAQMQPLLSVIDLNALMLFKDWILREKDSTQWGSAVAQVVQLTPVQFSTHPHQAWKVFAQWVLTEEGRLRKTVDKRQGFPAVSTFQTSHAKAEAKRMKESFLEFLADLNNPALIEALDLLRRLPDSSYAPAQWQMLEALCEILPEAVAQLYLLFQTRGQVDFSAIAQSALTALGTDDEPTEVTLQMDQVVQHLLIDEFQDTSWMQFQLVAKCVAGWLPESGRTLFLVGDPMQSIYRFRQAEVGLFMRAKYEGIGPIRLQFLTLTQNFRSSARIVDWVNHALANCFPAQEDIYLGAVPYVPAVATQLGAVGGVHVHLSTRDHVTDAVQRLQALLQDPALQSIAVLVRTRAQALPLMQALQQLGVSYQALDMETLWDRPCIRQLFQLAKAHADLADDEAWVSVLLSPWCGLTLEDLWYLRQASPLWIQTLAWEENPHLEKFSAPGRLILQRVAPILRQVSALRCQQGLAKAVEQTWLTLGGPACVSLNDQLAVVQFFLLLQNAMRDDACDMALLERRLQRSFLPVANDKVRLQIMTIHKAKGLEFDAVVIPGLERTARAGAQELLLWDQGPLPTQEAFILAPMHPIQGDKDPLYAFIARHHRLREAYEQVRVLYVGLTRAKKQLHLMGCVSEDGLALFKPRAGSFLAALWEPISQGVKIEAAQGVNAEQPSHSEPVCKIFERIVSKS